MLGICTASKENLDTSSVEMAYSASLTVPGEFLLNTKSDSDIKRYLTELRDSVGQLRPTPMSTHSTPRSSIPNDHSTANFMFIQHDTTKTPPVTLPWPIQSYMSRRQIIPTPNWQTRYSFHR
uniref:Uncharacterized protein n=1 Tax=Octopus bimaculoides TaxID=37653 RepID=A0A0L8FTG6_OCTBM